MAGSIITGALMSAIGPMLPDLLDAVVGAFELGDGKDGKAPTIRDLADRFSALGFSDRAIAEQLFAIKLGWDAQRVAAVLRPVVAHKPPVDDPQDGLPLTDEPQPVAPALVDDVPVSEIDFVRLGKFWPIVTDLAVRFAGGTLWFNHDADWRRTVNVSGKALAGNCWVGTMTGGPAGTTRWRMCPFEWFRPGQKDRRKGAATEAGHLLGGVRAPVAGEDVLFMVSTPARGSQRTDNERSRIVKVRWV